MRYYGNKTKLLDFISSSTKDLDISKDMTFFDLFSGTASVSKHFKKLDFSVISNDFLYFGYVLATTGISINKSPRFSKLKKTLNIKCDIVEYLNSIKGNPDFITKNYTPYLENNRQYFSIENGIKIDSIRITIEKWHSTNLIDHKEYCYLITSLLLAVSKVSNISGTYGSFLKKWDNRALKKLFLNHPDCIHSNKPQIALNGDAEKIVDQYEVDILYLDPPYNSRQYASNYFLLELIAEGWFNKNKPKIYGHTGMRPYNHQKSKFSMKREALNALKNVVNKAKAKYILLSYNNEGIISSSDIVEILSKRGNVTTKKFNHKRYRSIGQDGSLNKTTEYLYILEIKGI